MAIFVNAKTINAICRLTLRHVLIESLELKHFWENIAFVLNNKYKRRFGINLAVVGRSWFGEDFFAKWASLSQLTAVAWYCIHGYISSLIRLWLLCGSSSQCHWFVCSLWLWYFLIILTIFLQIKFHIIHYEALNWAFTVCKSTRLGGLHLKWVNAMMLWSQKILKYLLNMGTAQDDIYNQTHCLIAWRASSVVFRCQLHVSKDRGLQTLKYLWCI